jgi:glycerol dehydrogenase-like iron-containing ADH family enzyme
VSTQDVAALKDFSYRYYSHTLPKTHGNPTKATVKSAKRNALPAILGVGGGILLLILLVGG